ncbi:MAG: GNAT family N-acetyltransferase [Ruminococcus sp.]|nr:GNAT family N-acetyltransferase [Ruminococcus sp.]
MNYKIRLAIIEDIRNLAILKQKLWAETYRGIYEDDLIDSFNYEKAENKFYNIITDNKIDFFVVESEDKLVGYMAIGRPLRTFKNYEQELILLYLLESFQRRGIGRELFELACHKVKDNGYTNLFVSCNKYNMIGRDFYEKMNGKIIYEDEDSNDKRHSQVKCHYDVRNSN